MGVVLSTFVILAWDHLARPWTGRQAWIRHPADVYPGHPFDVTGAYTRAGFVRLL